MKHNNATPLPAEPAIQGTAESVQADLREVQRWAREITQALRLMNQNLYEDLAKGAARHKIYTATSALASGLIDEGELKLYDNQSGTRRLYTGLNNSSRYVNFDG